MKRQRPGCLTLWLIFLALGSLYTIYTYTLGAATLPKIDHALPSWAFIFHIVHAIVYIVGIVLLWNWKKSGFYLIIGLTVAAVLVNILTFGVFGLNGILSIIGAPIGIGILYLAMKPAWQNFTPLTKPKSDQGDMQEIKEMQETL